VCLENCSHVRCLKEIDGCDTVRGRLFWKHP
jgi:hypothetical protein